MYTLQQSDLVNDLHSRIWRKVEINMVTAEERAAVLEAARTPSVRPKAQFIMRSLPGFF